MDSTQIVVCVVMREPYGPAAAMTVSERSRLAHLFGDAPEIVAESIRLAVGWAGRLLD